MDSNGKIAEEFQRTMAFQRLRLGFKLSAVATAMLAAAVEASFEFVFVFLLFPAVIIYVLSIHERASGWNLLGLRNTYVVLWSCAIILIPSLLGSVFLGIYGGTYALLIPLLAWGFYTYVENRSINELDKRFGLGLRQARLIALFGVLAMALAYCYELYKRIPSLLYRASPFPGFIFVAPFLIVSCLLLIRGLGSAIKSQRTQISRENLKARLD
jgi:hypothetical protein